MWVEVEVWEVRIMENIVVFNVCNTKLFVFYKVKIMEHKTICISYTKYKLAHNFKKLRKDVSARLGSGSLMNNFNNTKLL